MKNRSSKALKLLRNMIIIATILIGLVLWSFIPDTFTNTRLFHVRNGETGSKYGVLLLLLFPLFALIPQQGDEIHTNDTKLRKELEENLKVKSYECQVTIAIAMAATVILLMVASILLL